MPDDLELFLALLVGIITRDQAGTRHALRQVAVTYDDTAAFKLIQSLSNSLQPEERFWFRNLLGPRKEQAPPDELGITEPEPLAA